MIRLIFGIFTAILCNMHLQAQVRTEYSLKEGWKFSRDDSEEFIKEGYNDSKWQNVVVPHDWAIYGLSIVSLPILTLKYWIWRLVLSVLMPWAVRKISLISRPLKTSQSFIYQ